MSSLESHDESHFAQAAASSRRGAARILVVGGDPDLRAALAALLQERQHRCTHVSRAESAEAAIARHRYDLLLVHDRLPDGSGLDLVRRLCSDSARVKVVLLTTGDATRTALDAFRAGAVDVVTLPAEPKEIIERAESALVKSRDERRRAQRVRRLRKLCRELGAARHAVADQVEALCEELAVAYHDLERQFDEVAVGTEFRTLLRMELDVEEVLRTTLEYLLTKTGPTNAAVFLPDPDRVYSLGAYVNYDCPRTSIDDLLDHLCRAICPQMEDEEEIVAFDDAREFAEWIGVDDQFFSSANVVAFSCRYRGETLAVVVLFRGRDTPFDESIAGTLDLLRGLFAEQLARLIDVHHRARPHWPDSPDEEDDDDFGFGFDLAA